MIIMEHSCKVVNSSHSKDFNTRKESKNSYNEAKVTIVFIVATLTSMVIGVVEQRLSHVGVRECEKEPPPKTYTYS